MTIRIDGTNTAASPGITGADTDTGLQFGTDEVSIVTGGTDRVKINSAGSIEATSAADVRLTLGSSGTAGTNDSVHIRGDGANLLFMNGAGGITRFEQNGTEELRIQSGGGISFNGDTATANALDDYEEGTYTPTAVTSGVSLTVTNARYTKIGRKVHVDVDITVGSNSLGSNFGITLPFAMESTGYYGSGLAGWADNTPGVKFHIGANQAYGMKMDATNQGNNHLQNDNMSNIRFIGNFTYEADN